MIESVALEILWQSLPRTVIMSFPSRNGLCHSLAATGVIKPVTDSILTDCTAIKDDPINVPAESNSRALDSIPPNNYRGGVHEALTLPWPRVE